VALENFDVMRASSFALETKIRLAEVEILAGDRPDEALASTSTVLELAGDAADMAALHACALRLRAAARLQLRDEDGAREDLVESVETARGADALYEVALGLDLRALMDGDADAAEESAELFRRLGVERVARPPLPS